MTKPDPRYYAGREQAFVKHLVLTQYLERLAIKIGWHGRATLNYVDGFSGPWQSRDDAFADTSPHLAIRALRSARNVLHQQRRPGIHPRVFFVEDDRKNYEQLAESLRSVTDIEHTELCGSFEDHISDAKHFAEHGSDAFAFIFIDPTGWTGLALDTISPLLRTGRCEVLVNFMTKDIVRFIDHPDSANERSFSQLFGSLQCREEWKALQGLEREEAIVATYCDRIRTSGNFKFAVSAVVLNPQVDRSHYHLIYATRHPEGLVTFRNEERAALPVQSSLRAGVKDRMRRTKDATGLLFGPEAVDTPFVERLRARYRTRATERALGRRVSGDRIRFDEFAWSLMEVPMIAEKDVKEIVAELQRQSVLTVEGLPPRKRVPGLGEDHFIRWR